MPQILIVDSNTGVVTFYENLLAEYQFTIHVAGFVQPAWEIVNDHDIDLVVVDANLPDRSGVDFIAEIRAQGIDVPVIFTADDWLEDDAYQQLTGELLVRKVLRKPVSANELLVQVQMILGALPDEDLLEVPAQPIGAEELDAQSVAARIKEHRARVEQHIDQHVAALDAAIADKEDGKILEGIARNLRDTAGALGHNRLTTLSEGVLQIAEGGGEQLQRAVDAFKTARHYITVRLTDERGALLLVDDDSLRADQLVEQAKTLGFRLDRAGNLDTASVMMHEGNYEGAVITMSGKRFDPHHVSRVLRNLVPLLPIGFVGDPAGIDERVAAIHAGASVVFDPDAPAELEAGLSTLVALRRAQKPRVLLVDDTGDFHRGVGGAISDWCTLDTLEQPRELFDVLNAKAPDVVLIAADLAGASGFDLCRLIRATTGWQHLPVVMMFRQAQPEARVAAFECGADDWVALPIIPEELLGRVRARAERARRLQEGVELDPLTGVRTRRAFVRGVTSRLADCKRTERSLTVALLNINELGTITEIHGEATAEAVLIGLGRLLANRFRASDLRARWAGDTFAVCLVGVTAAEAGQVLDRARLEFEALRFEGPSANIHASFSTRLATYPTDGDNLESLIQAAREKN